MLAETKDQPIAVDAETIRGWMECQEAVLIDVREPMEHAAERIPGARLFPLSALDPRAVPPADGKKLVLLCRTGRRSAEAGQKLLAAGFPEVYHLQGGMTAWKETGCPVEASADAPLDLMRQVQIAAGSLVFLGTVLGATVSPWFLLLSGGVGAGLMFAGATGTCGLAMLLARMPWNRTAAVTCGR
jgi:rhodanese-related sulfurtransferase